MNGGLPMLVDGHMHLENGPLTKEYVMEFINEAYKQGFDRIQILDHTHRFKELFIKVLKKQVINKENGLLIRK